MTWVKSVWETAHLNFSVDNTDALHYNRTMSKKTYQGDIGVAAAMLYYSIHRFSVSVPSTEHSKYDLIIEKEGKIQRVQVKTSNYKPNDKYLVQLRTNGGNQSTKTKITRLSKKEIDLVFILCGDGNIYELPIDLVDGKSEVSISSEKYNAYLMDNLGLNKLFDFADMV